MEILRHHARDLERNLGFCGGNLKKLEGALALHAADDLPYVIVRDQQAYPKLGQIEVRERFVAAQMAAVRSLLEGTAVVLPEREPDGRYNKDAVCEACGNLGANNRCLHYDLFSKDGEIQE